MKFKNTPTKTVPINKIKFDGTNPNIMTAAEEDALFRVMEKHGIAVDPWLNQNNDGTYTVIDGEHRIKTILKTDTKTITAKIFKVDENGLKLLRQIANKLRGKHDPELDKKEYVALYKAGLLDTLAEETGQNPKQLEKIATMIQNAKEEIIETPEEIRHHCIVDGCDHGCDHGN